MGYVDVFAGPEYTGQPFKFLDPTHVTTLIIFALVIGSVVVFGPQASARGRVLFRYGLAGVLLVNESLWHWWNWKVGLWTVQTLLPLHLCSVLVFISAAMLITKHHTLYEVVYLLGISGASQALLTPDVGAFGFPHLRYMIAFVSHGGIVTAAVYMTVVEKYRVYWRSLGRVIVGMNLYVLVVGLINLGLGSNYLLVAHKPDVPTLLDYLGPWPWYIVAMEAIGLALSLLLYLPFYWRDQRAPKGA